MAAKSCSVRNPGLRGETRAQQGSQAELAKGTKSIKTRAITNRRKVGPEGFRAFECAPSGPHPAIDSSFTGRD